MTKKTQYIINQNPNDYKYQITSGFDGHTYVSKLRTKTEFHWIRLPDITNRFKIEKFVYGSKFNEFIKYDYKDFLKKFTVVKRMLKRNNMFGVYLDNQGIWSLDGYHFVDYMLADARKVLKDTENSEFDDHSVLVLDDVELWNAAKKGTAYITYNLIYKDKPMLYKVLREVFGKQVTLPKSASKSIIIKLNKL